MVDIPEKADLTVLLGLILTEELLQFMVERTNYYAQKFISGKTMSRRSKFKNWKATNISEMKTFSGFLLHMGVVNYLISKTIGQEIHYFNQMAFGNT